MRIQTIEFSSSFLYRTRSMLVCVFEPQEPANKHAAHCPRIEQQFLDMYVRLCAYCWLVTSLQMYSIVMCMCMRASRIVKYLNALFF